MREIKFRVWIPDEKQMHHFDLNEGLKNIPLETNPVIMQYTGLKDKKCKEIYEGDIIKCKDTLKREHITDIVFRKGKFHGSDEFASDYLIEEMQTYGDVEVIGNIYENNELIKGDMK